MWAYHYATYLKLKGRQPRLQRKLLSVSYRSLAFTKFITFPQKLGPAIMALYWLAKMWKDVDEKPVGRFWLAWCTVLLSALLTLQVKFCDDVFPICNHVRYKLYGGVKPSRRGPVMTLLLRVFGRDGKRRATEERGLGSTDSSEKTRSGSDASRTRQFKIMDPAESSWSVNEAANELEHGESRARSIA